MLGPLSRLVRPRSRLARPCRARASGREALEVGGPSRIFSAQGRLPVYPFLAALDLVDFAPVTLWRPAGRTERSRALPPGRRLEAEAAELSGLPGARYGLVLASHVLEHLANPLGALAAWRRVLDPDGALLLVVPHRDGTFDHRRPVTSLAHLVQDLERSTREDDLTHLEEILRLHDLARDPKAGDAQAFAARARDNARVRALHHHVFDTALALAALGRAGYGVEGVDTMRPWHIALLARPGAPVDEALLGPGAPWRRHSPFATDRSPRSECDPPLA